MLHLRSDFFNWFFDLCRDGNADLPENFHALDKGTHGLIYDLLRERDKVRRQLDAAQTDQAIIRGQLTTADARVASKLSRTSSPYCCFSFLPLTFFFSDLESQV